MGFAFDAVLLVDGEDVFLEDGVVDGEGFGHFIVSAVAQEHFEDRGTAGDGALVDGRGRSGRELEFFGEGVDVGDSLLFADLANGAYHGVEGLAEVAGDLEIGPADRRRVRTCSRTGDWRWSWRVRRRLRCRGREGFGDFVAVEQAGNR